MYKLCDDVQISFHTMELRAELSYESVQFIIHKLYEKAARKEGLAYRENALSVRYACPSKGIQLKIWQCSNLAKYFAYLIVNPRKIIGDFTHIGLMKLDYPFTELLEEEIAGFWRELGVPFDFKSWSFSRLDIACQFHTHFGKLLVKLLRNQLIPKTFTLLQTGQRNRMRSFYAKSREENIQLYDKQFKMERDGYTQYTDRDWEEAENLWRFELQLHSSRIRQIEREHGITGSFAEQVAMWGAHSASILADECDRLFGPHYYLKMPDTRKLLTNSFIISEYLDLIAQENSVPKAWNKMKEQGKHLYIKKRFFEAGINPVVLPDALITNRERCHFPIPPFSKLFIAPKK